MREDDETFLNVIARYIWRYWRNRRSLVDFDDVLQTARIELWNAEQEGLRDTPLFKAKVFYRTRNALTSRYRTHEPVVTTDTFNDAYETDFDTKHDVDALLRRLSDDERELVRLVYYEDVSVVDAARLVGLTNGGAYKRLHCALGKMLADEPLTGARALELYEARTRKQKQCRARTLSTADLSVLTDRERRVYELRRKGLSIKAIATALGVKYTTASSLLKFAENRILDRYGTFRQRTRENERRRALRNRLGRRNRDVPLRRNEGCANEDREH